MPDFSYLYGQVKSLELSARLGFNYLKIPINTHVFMEDVLGKMEDVLCIVRMS